MSAPSSIARANDTSVFSGHSAAAPRWPMRRKSAPACVGGGPEPCVRSAISPAVASRSRHGVATRPHGSYPSCAMAKRQQPWTRLTVRVPAAVADALGARCIELGAPGVVTDERDLRRDATTDGKVRRSVHPTAARFTAYFPPRLDPRRLEAELHLCLDKLARELPEARHRSLKLEPYEPESWASTWREHFPPVRVGRRLLIAPSWTPARELRRAGAGRIVLRVDPARAFGTGHHPTTRGCLVALERVCAGGVPRRGLDVGCGTGVLAVAMRA
ncbi:MAG: hypothetical protein FJ148_28515, partial [Deltaproteobacteria bacterium]|nr:hypothetical protein [Deltaproteobacteria bacterium]